MPAEVANESGAHPDTVSRKSFGTSFRGYDQLEVRAYLGTLAEQLRSLKERNEQLLARLQEAEERAGRIVELDEQLITRRLGEEAVQVLSSAREAAAQITAKAEANIARMLEEAQAEAAHRRQQAERELERSRQEADHVLTRAARDAAGEVEQARRRGREIVGEAQALRERVLDDLARRRRAARVQWEQFQAGRQKLLESYTVLRGALDDEVRQLHAALPEARAAAEAAGQHAVADAGPDDEIDVQAELADYLERQAATPRRRRSGGVPAVSPDADLEGVRVAGEDHRDAEPVGSGPADAEEAGSDEREAASSDVDAPEAGDVEPDGEGGDVEAPDLVPHGGEPEGADRGIDGGEPEAAPVEPASNGHPDETTGESESPESVDDLFARIRADRAAAVVEAEAVLAGSPGNGHEPAETTVVVATADDETATVVADAEEALDPDAVLVAERDVLVAPLERLAARRLKRALDDEQNEVLDQLRRSGLEGVAPVLDDPERFVRLSATVEGPLADAVDAGARSVGGSADAVPAGAAGAAAAAMVEDVAQPLSERLVEIVGEASEDDLDALADRIRATYREWKTARVDDAASHAVLTAFGQGSYAATPPSATLRWVVDRAGPACPDADDNALAGGLAKGEAFPTGHHHAPAHPGCRCLVTPELD